MSDRDADVLVIGAGINGAAVARELARAGRRVIVAERSAPAAGTSGRSSKLIHGGLRYLEHGDFALVRESLAARRALLRDAPHLVRRTPFHIPVYADSRRGAWKLRAGLALYALCAGLGRADRFESLPREAWPLADGLEPRGLRAVLRYHDAQTDDAALTRWVLDDALAHGATLRCPWEVTVIALEPDGVRISGAGSAGPATLSVRCVVNAAGPWVARVAARVAPSLPPLAVDLVKGSHIELAPRPLAGVYYLESPDDGRPLFVMPWQGRVLVGTTEVPCDDARLDGPRPSAAEIAYLQRAVARRFPAWSRDGGLEPVAAWAGIRVLPRAAGALNARSRELALAVDREQRPRFVSLLGGKLTTHAATATRVVERLELG